MNQKKTSELNDRELIKLIQMGDQLAGRVLYERHKDFVKNVLYKRLGNSADLDDVVQETFIRFFKNSHNFDTGTKRRFEPYIATIAVHTSIDRFRKSERSPKTVSIDSPIMGREGDYFIVETAGPEFTPQQVLESVESQIRQIEAVRLALSKLPRKLSEPLELCYFQGLTIDQAAEQIGIAVGTVKSRMNAGREAIRQLYKGPLPEKYKVAA